MYANTQNFDNSKSLKNASCIFILRRTQSQFYSSAKNTVFSVTLQARLDYNR